jgi:hypothetical protein
MQQITTKQEFKKAFDGVREYNVMPNNDMQHLVFIDEDNHKEYKISFENVFKIMMEVNK